MKLDLAALARSANPQPLRADAWPRGFAAFGDGKMVENAGETATEIADLLQPENPPAELPAAPLEDDTPTS